MSGWRNIARGIVLQHLEGNYRELVKTSQH